VLQQVLTDNKKTAITKKSAYGLLAKYGPGPSAVARNFMDEAASLGHDIMVSPISLAELVYLVEKGRLDASAYRDLKAALVDPQYLITEAPFTAEVIEAMWLVSRTEIPDLPDRVIAATGVFERQMSAPSGSQHSDGTRFVLIPTCALLN